MRLVLSSSSSFYKISPISFLGLAFLCFFLLKIERYLSICIKDRKRKTSIRNKSRERVGVEHTKNISIAATGDNTGINSSEVIRIQAETFGECSGRISGIAFGSRGETVYEAGLLF